jgi:peptidyl-dipeptidase Dcp
MPSANPFFEESSLFLNYPQFGLIENSHYLPAFERGIAEQLAEVEAIANQQAEANFENTIIALEVSGQLLDRVSRVFFSMAGCAYQ